MGGLMLVRHSPTRAVLADVEKHGQHYRLVRISPHNGPLPECGHLIGQVFPDLAAIRRALIAAMKGTVGDTLDNVLLSAAAYTAWQETAISAAKRLVAQGMVIESIPDEMAKPLPDGRLLIWVDLPDGQKVELAIAKTDWAWRRRPN
jgi:DNA-binding transcriptional LysR family regulator